MRLAVSYPVVLSALVSGCREVKNQLLLTQSWMEAGEIHSDSFVYLHVFHFNFLDGGEHFRNSLKYTLSVKDTE